MKSMLARAKRGFREDFRLYLTAVSTLSVGFLALGAVLIAAQNLVTLNREWSETRRMTVYIKPDVPPADAEQLRALMQGLPQVKDAAYVSSDQARSAFASSGDLGDTLAVLGPEAFPASIEVRLQGASSEMRMEELSERVKQFSVVEDVDTYGAWFGRLDKMTRVGKQVVLGVALLVVICVLAVIGNTIRLAVSGRRSEIEVMKLCGATDGFVRGPFVVEGAFQGFAAAVLAIALLLAGFVFARNALQGSVASLMGIELSFLHPLILFAVIGGGALLGGLGSAISLRRYLEV